MKPYLPRHLTEEQIVFNFRASHYQRVSENGSGILASRFRLFLSCKHLVPGYAKLAALSAVSLHYMLGEKYADTYTYIYQPVIRISKRKDGIQTRESWRNEFDATLVFD